MRILYLDIFSGISGDMLLGALLDLGVSERALRRELAKLRLPGYMLSVKRASQRGIAGMKCDVQVREAGSLIHRHHDHRAFSEIRHLIERSKIDKETKARAVSIFARVAKAEAKIHGVPVAKVHFHEVGAVDSIVDIVGAAIAMRELDVDTVMAREVEEGTGFVEIAHGRFPIPAPATLEILRGVKIRQCDEPHEMVTPTGAAILAEFVQNYGPMPEMTIERIGYGVGTHEFQTRPNVLRAVLGSSNLPSFHPSTLVTVIETNIDDMNPQLFGDVMERLFAAGALDAFYTPIQMKKNRPGTLLTVLAEPKLAEKLIGLILEHTTTFGVRVTEARRTILDREIKTVKTRYGLIAIKLGKLHDRVLTASPEYDSCKQAAERHKVPLKQVLAAVQQEINHAH